MTIEGLLRSNILQSILTRKKKITFPSDRKLSIFKIVYFHVVFEALKEIWGSLLGDAGPLAEYFWAPNSLVSLVGILNCC